MLAAMQVGLTGDAGNVVAYANVHVYAPMTFISIRPLVSALARRILFFCTCILARIRLLTFASAPTPMWTSIPAVAGGAERCKVK